MTQTPTQPTKIASTWNEVTFTGNLGKDPEMSYTPNGNACTKFSIAVGQGKDGKGNFHPSMWLNVETWKQLAEQCNSKLAKGARVEIKGRLVQDHWEKDGQKRSAFKVVAQTVRLLKKSDGKAATGFIDEDGAGGSDDNDTLGELDDHPF
jgi:single-strand DNA-binding protein